MPILSPPSYTGKPQGCVLQLTYALNLVSKTPDTRFTNSPPFNQLTNTVPTFLYIDQLKGFIFEGSSIKEGWNVYQINVIATDKISNLTNEIFTL